MEDLVLIMGELNFSLAHFSLDSPLSAGKVSVTAHVCKELAR
jgi:hypothetical protein